MILFLILLFTGFATQGPDDRIAETLLRNGLAGKDQSFLIILRAQADLSVIRSIHGKQAKGRQAFDLLKATAASSQGPILRLLGKEKALAQPYYVINMVRSFGNLDLMRKVAAHPSVAYIAADSPVSVPDYREEVESPLRGFEDLTWGLSKIQADSVWALGYTGQGAVIGGQDTGYEWDHPALAGTYRGNTGGQVDHNYNWHDAIHQLNPINGDTTNNPLNNPCGLDSPVPCDDNNHGTHTMGTMAGLDSALQIGVAPDARWIGCRNMERGWGTPSTYIECFEWFLAPTDLNNENPDPDKAPHVIANSWSCPQGEGCNPSNFALMEMVVNNLKNAGVVVVVSAGNSGSGCSSVSTPAAIFESSFTIGATRENDTIANFSSRGPVLVDGSGRMKPDLSAPGVNVRSSIPGGGYANFSGTSMAGPHVAGAVALIISARPELAGEVDEIEDLLKNTARIIAASDTCGGVPGTEVPNNTYGWGRIDVFEAVKLALDQSSTTTNIRVQSCLVLPNPFNDYLQVTWPGIDGMGTFQLYDLSGRLVFQQQVSFLGETPISLSMPSIHPGFYSYRIIAGNHLASGKLLRS